MDDVPIWHKKCLTIEEASKLYNIGTSRLRSMTDEEDCKFVLHVGNKRLIKVQKFDEYINADFCYSI
ncbi:MAG: helix-turn-helix domain-containing protein [Clostridia bacterium]|nr:helix-turn-helix domain-containing protein [Clostridia bacterium]